jgi:hypothetical protein
MVNIGRYDENYLLQRAEEIVTAKTAGSMIMDPQAEAAVPRFLPQGNCFRCDLYCDCGVSVQTITSSTHFAHYISQRSLELFGHSRYNIFHANTN